MKTDTPTKTIVKLEFAMHQLRTPTHKRGHLLGSPGMISCPTRVEKHKLNRNPWDRMETEHINADCNIKASQCLLDFSLFVGTVWVKTLVPLCQMPSWLQPLPRAQGKKHPGGVFEKPHAHGTPAEAPCCSWQMEVHPLILHIYLVGGWPTPLKNMILSVGMMTFPIYGKMAWFSNCLWLEVPQNNRSLQVNIVFGGWLMSFYNFNHSHKHI